MSTKSADYKKYFSLDQQVKISILMADNKIQEATCLVRFINKDRLTLELIGEEFPEDMLAGPGTEVFITSWTGWSLFRCNAVLTQNIIGRSVILRLTAPVVEKQTREYFRLDVSIPARYTLPKKQQVTEVKNEWTSIREQLMQTSPQPLLKECGNSYKVVKWNGEEDILPWQVNLSGGGLRLRMAEQLEVGTLVIVGLFLPLNPVKVIHVMAEVVRSSEILLSREKDNRFITAMRFHSIIEADRETIIAFIFSEHRRMLHSNSGKPL